MADPRSQAILKLVELASSSVKQADEDMAALRAENAQLKLALGCPVGGEAPALGGKLAQVAPGAEPGWVPSAIAAPEAPPPPIVPAPMIVVTPRLPIFMQVGNALVGLANGVLAVPPPRPSRPLQVGDTVMLIDHTDPSLNGSYIMTGTGSATSSWVLTRPSSASAPASATTIGDLADAVLAAVRADAPRVADALGAMVEQAELYVDQQVRGQQRRDRADNDRLDAFSMVLRAMDRHVRPVVGIDFGAATGAPSISLAELEAALAFARVLMRGGSMPPTVALRTALGGLIGFMPVAERPPEAIAARLDSGGIMVGGTYLPPGSRLLIRGPAGCLAFIDGNEPRVAPGTDDSDPG